MTRKHLLSKNNIGLCSLIFRAKNISIKHEFELSKSKNQTLDWITNVKLDLSLYAPPMNKYAYLKCYLPKYRARVIDSRTANCKVEKLPEKNIKH